MKTTSQILKLGLAALLLAMTSPTLQAAPPKPLTGIQGQAMLYIADGGTPSEEEPGVWFSTGYVEMEMPVAASFSVFAARSGHGHSSRELGRFFGRFSTDASGAFTISLPPGNYVIVPDALPAPFSQSIPPDSFEVTVRARQLTSTQILYYQDEPLDIIPMLSQN